MNNPRYNKIMSDCAMACRLDDATKSSSFVSGDCNRICVPSIQPTTFGNADLASNFAFVLVDGSCP